MIWTLPNILTLLRLASALVLVLGYAVLARPWADFLALGLFVAAALTDWLDGRLARRLGQVSRFGTMLDPIADKAMVVIALLVVAGYAGMTPLIVLPGALILMREVAVSGLREYLGDNAHALKVTPLAKWKTTAQMAALSLLFGDAILLHYFGMWTLGMDRQMVTDILAGRTPDELGLRWLYRARLGSWYGGLGLWWLATALTVATGWDYFAKARPYLREGAET